MLLDFGFGNYFCFPEHFLAALQLCGHDPVACWSAKGNYLGPSSWAPELQQRHMGSLWGKLRRADAKRHCDAGSTVNGFIPWQG